MDFTREELNQIRVGANPDWKRIGDSSAYGGIFKSPTHPGRVIKIQYGHYDTYDNEINKQFDAFLKNPGDYEVPQIHSSRFIPNDPETPKGMGLSYIDMDEADFTTFDGSNNKARHAHARGLSSLYKNAGISHTDDHGGNIKYNAKTDQPVLLDFGLARNVKDEIGLGKTAEWIKKGLKASNNTDMYDLFSEELSNLYQRNQLNPGENSFNDLKDLIMQGQEVVEMTHPDIAPVNWTKSADQEPASIKDTSNVKFQGAKEWATSSNNFNGQNDRTWKSADSGSLKPNNVPSKLKNFGPAGAALSVGAVDAIPSRETVQTLYKDGPVAALKQHGTEFVKGVPVAAGIGALSIPIPAIGAAMPHVAPGFAAVAAANAADEIVTQQTGEGIIPKFRQFLGTEKRTGYASPNNSLQEQIKRARDLVNNPPTITKTNPKTHRYGDLSKAPSRALARRGRMAMERFNPSKLEFGISELLFGR